MVYGVSVECKRFKRPDAIMVQGNGPMVSVIHFLNCNFRIWLLLALIIPVTAGCIGPRYWDGYVGKVVDADTGEPLDHVFVIARYWGDLPAGGSFQSVCYHAGGTTTNEQGEYRMNPRFDTPDFYFDKRSDIDFFKAGYQRVYYKDGVAKLKEDTSNNQKRLEYLKRMARYTCRSAGRSQRSLYPFFEAIFYEAKSISVTSNEKKDLEKFRWVAASQAIASDRERNMDGSEYSQLIKDYLKDHLQ
jgi:hypothetical protein